jgi:solute carrier family 35, member C2
MARIGTETEKFEIRNGRKRSNHKLKNNETIPAEIDKPPGNCIDPNISGLAKFNLKSDSTDLSDLQAEIETIERIGSGGGRNVWRTNFIIFSLSFIVVASAITVTIFQSMLLSANHYYFPFPIFSAAVTNFVQLLASAVILGYFGRLGLLGREIMTSDGWKATYQAILPCSFVTAAELSISLVSLQYVTVSFFTMVKSSSIIFILIGAFMTGQERVNAFLLAVILLTGAGVILAAWDPKSTAGLEIIGFSLVLIASILNACKWILTEMLLNENLAFKNILDKLNAPDKKYGKTRNLTPLLSVLLIAPITFGFLIIGAIFFEGFPLQLFSFISYESNAYVMMTMGSLFLSSFLVFIMRIADFRLVQLVSLVTFSLLGIIKEIIMIGISVLFLGEVLFPVNIAGLIVTIIGVALYNYYRILERRQEEAIKKGNFEIELQLRQRTTQILSATVK